MNTDRELLQKGFELNRFFYASKRHLKRIFIGLIWAFIFVLPVYAGAFFLEKQSLMELMIFDSIFGLVSVGIWLKVPLKVRFWFGFFVGLFLFYWIGLSFRFNNMAFLMPFVSVLIALAYGVIIYFLLWFESGIYRIFTLMIMSYIHPFGFDWLIVESFFSYSIFDVDKLSFFWILLGVLGLIHLKRGFKIIGLCFLLFSLNGDGINGKLSLPLDLAVTQTDVNQDFKWQAKNIQKIVDDNFKLIKKAIAEHKDGVILPETAFPFILDRTPLKEELQELSKQIVIVTGALRQEDNKVYNSTYLFQNGNFSYADKVILAPFGEKIPLPEFLAKPIAMEFFGQADLLSAAKDFGWFDIKGNLFGSAICYEGTSEIVYESSPKYLILISNNAWFVPSIEPYFQRMLIKYYARMHQKIVIHSVNQSSSYIVSPFVLGDKFL